MTTLKFFRTSGFLFIGLLDLVYSRVRSSRVLNFLVVTLTDKLVCKTVGAQIPTCAIQILAKRGRDSRFVVEANTKIC